MKLVIDERAVEDLQDIAAWIGKDHPGAARRMIDALVDALERLAELPRLGREGRVPGTYEWVLAPYIIVYHISQRPLTVVIRGVFHSARKR